MSEKRSVDSIFCSAIEIESTDERSEYLRGACADDPELDRQVQRLLDAHFRGGSILDSPPHGLGATIDQSNIDQSNTDQPITEKTSTQIGPYKLLQKLGEGGMGVVYMADQKTPFQRRVALKIIKPGMDTQQVIARFEAERLALALMDHPGIAHVLDAGTTNGGRPFFAMELVKGVPITQYCDEKRLTLQQRLELFVDVCHAVQHAHQKGIIHRDIKPSNVLVAEYDDHAVPKVIDFGVAKAVQQQLTEKTMFTQVGQVVGTLEYMSPEQAKLNQLDVDTRSDIYALGVLLYELLTGATPFDRRRLQSAAFDEMLRILREEEPPKPSLKVSTSESLPSIAANRHVEPKKLSVLVRGELDWIVMKAMEKDRSRRYDSANGFASDIERYLGDEPVSAGPPTLSYRARKFARRNKGLMASTTAVLASMLIGLAAFGLQYKKIEKQRNDAMEMQATLRNTLELFFNALGFGEFSDLSVGHKKKIDFKGVHYTVAQVVDDLSAKLESDDEIDPEIAYMTHCALGEFYRLSRKRRQAAIEYESAAEIIEGKPAVLGDRWRLYRMAGIELRPIDPVNAERVVRKMGHLEIESGRDQFSPPVLHDLALVIARQEGRKQESRELLARAIELFRTEIQYDVTKGQYDVMADYGWALIALALFQTEDGNLGAAYAATQEYIRVSEASDHMHRSIAGRLSHLSTAAIENGDYSLAMRAIEDSIRIHQETGWATSRSSRRLFNELARISILAAARRDADASNLLEQARTQMRDFLADAPEFAHHSIHYNLACVESRLAETASVSGSDDVATRDELVASALGHLKEAFELGLRDIEALMLDADLRFLRLQPEFRRTLNDHLGILGVAVKLKSNDSANESLPQLSPSSNAMILIQQLPGVADVRKETCESIGHYVAQYGERGFQAILLDGGEVIEPAELAVLNDVSHGIVRSGTLTQILEIEDETSPDLSGVNSLLLDSDGLIVSVNPSSVRTLLIRFNAIR